MKGNRFFHCLFLLILSGILLTGTTTSDILILDSSGKELAWSLENMSAMDILNVQVGVYAPGGKMDNWTLLIFSANSTISCEADTDE